jgi:hypothetical protein
VRYKINTKKMRALRRRRQPLATRQTRDSPDRPPHDGKAECGVRKFFMEILRIKSIV